MNSLYEEKLRKLLEEGKITPEQYEELRTHLPMEEHVARGEGKLSEQRKASEFKSVRRTPWNVWCAAGLYFLAALNNLVGFATGHAPWAALYVPIQIALGVGLVYANRWAFGLGLLFAVLHVGYTAMYLPKLAVAFIVNAALTVFLLSAYRYFYPLVRGVGGEEAAILSRGKESVRRVLPRLPLQVALCVIFLLVMAVLDIAQGMFQGSIVCVVLAAGLFYAQKWAFIITIVLGVIHIGYNILHLEEASSLIVLGANVAFTVVLCSAYGYFFGGGRSAAVRNRAIRQ
jgi:hypothetical protein